MSEHKIIKELTVVEYSPCGWKKKQKMFIVDGNEAKFAQYLGLDADKYPLGTRFQVVMLETEQPKERIVLPKGMEWVDHYDKQYDMLDSTTLFTIDGLKIAQVFNSITDDYYCICYAPWDKETVRFHKKTLEDGKEEVLEVCAKNNWYGIKKL